MGATTQRWLDNCSKDMFAFQMLPIRFSELVNGLLYTWLYCDDSIVCSQTHFRFFCVYFVNFPLQNQEKRESNAKLIGLHSSPTKTVNIDRICQFCPFSNKSESQQNPQNAVATHLVIRLLDLVTWRAPINVKCGVVVWRRRTIWNVRSLKLGTGCFYAVLG